MISDLDPGAPTERGDMSAAEYELAKRKANFGDLPELRERVGSWRLHLRLPPAPCLSTLPRLRLSLTRV